MCDTYACPYLCAIGDDSILLFYDDDHVMISLMIML